MERVVSGTTKEPELGWLNAAKESVVLVATPSGHGSGVCYERRDDYDYILTAKHVVQHEGVTEEPEITLMGATNSKADWMIHATLARISQTKDCAIVIAYDPYNLIKVARFADFCPLPGELVVAMGFPSNHYPVYVTVGFVIGWCVWDAVYLEHSASIWFGNSGGPLFNSKGEVIGINVRINGVNGHPDSGDCGAVPVEDIRTFLGI